MPMTREQAERFLAMNPGLARAAPSRDEAIVALMQMDPSDVQVGSPVGERPQGAIATALLAAEPKTVTPASPAPMQPGIQLQAPKPVASQLPVPTTGGAPQRRQLLPDDVRQMAVREAAPMAEEAPPPPAAPEAPRQQVTPRAYNSPLRGALSAAEKELADMNAAAEAILASGQPLPPQAQVQIEVARRKVAQYRAEVEAEEGAELPKEIADLLARREERIQGEEERLKGANKDALSDALIKGGLAMMNPQRGANFLAALSSGLGQGLETYDASKAAIAEKRARLGQGRDEIVLQRYDALTKAREAARAAAARGQQMDKDSLTLMNTSNQVLFDVATMPDRIEREGLDTTIKRVESEYAPKIAAAKLTSEGALARARDRSNQGGGGSTTNLKAAGSLLASYDREATALVKTINSVIASDTERAKASARLLQVDAERRRLRNLMSGGQLSPPAAKPAIKGRILSATPIAQAKK